MHTHLLARIGAHAKHPHKMSAHEHTEGCCKCIKCLFSRRYDVTIVWPVHEYKVTIHLMVIKGCVLDYCSKRAFALEHFVQCKSIREEVEHNTQATSPTLLTQHDRKQTLTWDVKRYKIHTSWPRFFFSFVKNEWSRPHIVFHSSHTCLCSTLWHCWSNFFFFFFKSLLLSPIKKNATGGCVKTSLFNIMEILY